MSDVQKTAAPLVDALATEEVSTSPGDLERFEIDGVRPSVAVRPRSTESLCDVMRIAQEARLAVIPVGSGSSLASLNVPARYDAALAMEHFSRVLEYDPDNSFVRVEAGCTLGDLEETLANKGQCVRLDFVSRSARTIGGLVSRDKAAYRYLNTTIETFHRTCNIPDLMKKAGFANIATKPLTFGTVSLYSGSKP